MSVTENLLQYIPFLRINIGNMWSREILRDLFLEEDFLENSEWGDDASTKLYF